MKPFKHPLLIFSIVASIAIPAYADFGKSTELNLQQLPIFKFGVANDIGESAVTPEGYLRDKTESADQLVKVAANLQVEFVTRNAANKSDLMVLFPEDNPTHLIGCVEGKDEILANGLKNPSVQAINLSDGSVTTILRGMNRCDGIARTSWGTVLVTEEIDDGQAYEIINPLNTSENTVDSRATGAISGATAANIVKRDALPTKKWEGLAVLESGVVISGEELRPGTYNDDQGNSDTDGGAMFKFIPANLSTGGTISNLNESPLVAGSVYALQVSCVNSKVQFGQGCEVGNASWVEVSAANARIDANDKGATGFYRPEDLHRDPDYTGVGVRFCWTNTGNEGAQNYSELMCAIDSKPNEANEAELSVSINRFVTGNLDMNSFDSFEFQPGTGIHYIIEDHINGDIWACLPDGADRDILSDGCLKTISVVDSSAEPSGFFFTADGQTAYLSIQHSADADGTEFNGYGTDDILKITGFKKPVAAAFLDSMLNLGAGSANATSNNVIELRGFTFNNEISNANIRINMDGTWTLQ